MKKILFLLAFVAISVAASAQHTTPRFGYTKNSNNTGSSCTYAYASKLTATSPMALTPNAYETVITTDSLKNALTVTIATTNGYVGDKVKIFFLGDATGRTVTFSTGTAAKSTTMAVAATKWAVVEFCFNGVVWVEDFRMFQ